MNDLILIIIIVIVVIVAAFIIQDLIPLTFLLLTGHRFPATFYRLPFTSLPVNAEAGSESVDMWTARFIRRNEVYVDKWVGPWFYVDRLCGQKRQMGEWVGLYDG